jgi:hypothetical protein
MSGYEFKPINEIDDDYERERWKGGDHMVGAWVYYADGALIFHKANKGYEIDVESMTTSAEVLDWIFQIRFKPWIERGDMDDFLRLVFEILNPQATLCSWGHEAGPIKVLEVLADHAKNGIK